MSENECEFEEFLMRHGFTDHEARQLRSGVPVVRGMDTPISDLQPHYTDERFRDMHTVFLRTGYKTTPDGRYEWVKGAEYNYSDRIWQWDWDKAKQANEQARETVKDTRTAEYCETFLRLYFDNPNLKLVHIIAGVNMGNGYPYQVFGYITDTPSASSEEQSA